jgi:hypothetical protein
MLTRWPIITPLTGAAMALAAGLMLGGYMKPQLVTDHPLGPQILTPGSAQGSSDPVDDGATLARYGAKIPDYVLGTDMTRPMVGRMTPAAEPAPAPAPAPQEDPPAERDRTDYQAPATTPASYPSPRDGDGYDRDGDGYDAPAPSAYSDQAQLAPPAG